MDQAETLAEQFVRIVSKLSYVTHVYMRLNEIVIIVDNTTARHAIYDAENTVCEIYPDAFVEFRTVCVDCCAVSPTYDYSDYTLLYERL